MSTNEQAKISTLNDTTEDYKYKVSIIVPCYNTKPWLDECLQSLVDQTLQNIEIICVNDGSTDGTGNKLDEWQTQYPNKIKVIHQTNSGASNARNTGMAMAQGECIGFVDSDDFIDLCMYEKVYKVLVDNNADVLQVGRLVFNDTDIIIKKKNDILHVMQVNPIKSLFNTSFLNRDVLFRKTFLQKNKISFLPNVYYLEDLSFLFDILFNGAKIFMVSNIFYYYRQNRLGQLTSVKSDVLYDAIKNYNYLENKYIKNCHNEEVKKYLVKNKLCQYSVSTLRINKQYKKDFMFKCANSIFNNYYNPVYIYKCILTTKYKKHINYLLGPISLILFHCCYLYQKLPFIKLKDYNA